MFNIFAPENDKKRLIALLVILAIVMIGSLVYKNSMLKNIEAPTVANTTTDTQQNSQTMEPITAENKAVENHGTSTVIELPPSPPIPTDEELKSSTLSKEPTPEERLQQVEEAKKKFVPSPVEE